MKTNQDPAFMHPDCTCAARKRPHEAYCPRSRPAWVRRALQGVLPVKDYTACAHG